MYLKVHVITESKEESVAEKGEVWYVSLREKAERGVANRRMLELLRSRLPEYAQFRIVSGHHSPHKIISAD